MLSIIIPVYRAAASLERVVDEIHATLPETPHEILLVDDRSPDESWGVIEGLCADDPRVHGIRLRENRGQQNALACGIIASKGDVIITMDDDGQHPASEIHRLLSTLESGADLAFVVPVEKPHKRYRYWGSFLTDRTFSLLIGKPPQIKISSFRAFEREIVRDLHLYPYRFLYLSAYLLGCAKRPITVEGRFRPRHHGESNYSLRRLLELYSRLLLYHASLPLIERFRKKGPLYRIAERR